MVRSMGEFGALWEDDTFLGPERVERERCICK